MLASTPPLVASSVVAQTARAPPARPAVLIVDDDREILESLRQLLTLRLPGVDVITASSGEEGLDIVRSRQPGVIVSDYRMAGMNGVDFLQQTVAIAPKAARLMMSAYAEPSVAVEALQKADLALMITKPFQLDYFVQLVGTLLKRRAA